MLTRLQRLTTEILIKNFFRQLKKILKKLLNLYRKAKMRHILARMNHYFINRKTKSNSM